MISRRTFLRGCLAVLTAPVVAKLAPPQVPLSYRKFVRELQAAGINLNRDVWHVQVLRRYNESLSLDYILPFRVITHAQPQNLREQLRRCSG